VANIQSPPAADITLNHKPSGGLWLSSNLLNISAMGMTVLELDTICTGFADAIEDTENNKITPGVAGLYLVIAQVEWYNTVIDKWYEVIILINSNDKARDAKQASISNKLGQGVSDLLYFSNTDYARLAVYNHDDDNSSDIALGQGRTFLKLTRIR